MNFSAMADELQRAYLVGFEDGKAATKEAMARLLDEMEQRYLGRAYAAEVAADHATYSAECSLHGWREEDMG